MNRRRGSGRGLDHRTAPLGGRRHQRWSGRRSSLDLRGQSTRYRRLRLVYLTALTERVRVPAGTLTVIRSPFFLPTSARPTGESTEIRPAEGSLSTAPTRWYVSAWPSESTTSMVDPGPA